MSLQKKILVVEDCREHMEILTEALSFLNFEVNGLSNGNQIPGLLEHFRPDLILIDYILPGENGILISKKLKMSYRTGHIPIILMSAYYFENKEITYADDFISKPIDLYLLDQKIRYQINSISINVIGNDLHHFSSNNTY